MAVVQVHVNCQLPELALFYSGILGLMWCVPMFFFLSGFFVKEERLFDTKVFLTTKFRGLYLKGLYYFIPAAILHNAFFEIGWYNPNIDYSGKFEKVLQTGDHILLIFKQFLLLSREPILGAMWFVDSLFIASVGLAAIGWFLKRTKLGGYKALCFIVLIFIIAFNILTNIYGITIPKVSNSITAMGLILLGGMMFKKGYCLKINKYSFAIALSVLWSISIVDHNINVGLNSYTSIVQLVGITVSAYYTLAYIAQKIENTIVGMVCAYIGEYSFAIMGLHIVGFKLCSTVLSTIFGKNHVAYCLTTPELGTDYCMAALYFLCGIIVPISIVRFIEFICTKIKNNVIR